MELAGRASTPEQKREITDRLLAAWLKVPELRLGQLIYCACPSERLFNLEDYPLIERIEEWM